MASLEQRINHAKSSAELEAVLRAIWGNKLVNQVIANSQMHVEDEIGFLQLERELNPVEYAFAVQNLSAFRKLDYLDNLRDYTILRHNSQEIDYTDLSEQINLEQILDKRAIEAKLHQVYFPSKEPKDPFELAYKPAEIEQQLNRVWGEDLMRVVFQQAFDIAYDLFKKRNNGRASNTQEKPITISEFCSEARKKFMIAVYGATKEAHQYLGIPYDELASSGLKIARIGTKTKGQETEARVIEEL